MSCPPLLLDSSRDADRQATALERQDERGKINVYLYCISITYKSLVFSMFTQLSLMMQLQELMKPLRSYMQNRRALTVQQASLGNLLLPLVLQLRRVIKQVKRR